MLGTCHLLSSTSIRKLKRDLVAIESYVLWSVHTLGALPIKIYRGRVGFFLKLLFLAVRSGRLVTGAG